MAVYTKDNRPTRLRNNDIVIIENLHYKVDTSYPARLRPFFGAPARPTPTKFHSY